MKTIKQTAERLGLSRSRTYALLKNQSAVQAVGGSAKKAGLLLVPDAVVARLVAARRRQLRTALMRLRQAAGPAPFLSALEENADA